LTKKNKVIPIDLDAWLEEVEKVKPLDRSKIASLAKTKPLQLKVKILENTFMQDSTNGVSKKFADLKVNDKCDIDANTRKKMDRGEIEIDATLDLHNQTMEVAYLSLVQFINQSYKLSRRMLLVITGKGKRSGDSLTIIKNELLVWINDPMLRNKIIRFSQAHRKHGGGGAYYILLKRHKLQK
jgi:DNA-nicking Smr family endonuclease